LGKIKDHHDHASTKPRGKLSQFSQLGKDNREMASKTKIGTTINKSIPGPIMIKHPSPIALLTETLRILRCNKRTP
jgi:hypothetical protein